MHIRKLTGFMGAELSGVVLKSGISAELAAELRAALGENHMIVLRGLGIDIARQKDLTRVFGDVMKLPYVVPTPDDEEVVAVLKEAGEVDTGVFGGEWHSDFSFLENPPAGSVLNAIEVPEVGGDTMWSSQVAAYETLPDSLREVVDSTRSVHVGAPYGVKYAPPEDTKANGSVQMTRGDPNADREILHPSVVTSPDTGKRALFVNPIYTTRFEGMSEKESRPILDALYRHATKPDFSCRLKWGVGDVVVWDNRMALHYATNDYDGSRRLLYRTTFETQPPA